MRLTNHRHDNLIQAAHIIAVSVFAIYWITKGTLWLYQGHRVLFWIALAWGLYVIVFWAVHLVRSAWDRLRPEQRPAKKEQTWK